MEQFLKYYRSNVKENNGLIFSREDEKWLRDNHGISSFKLKKFSYLIACLDKQLKNIPNIIFYLT
jgi:hypothetical protein